MLPTEPQIIVDFEIEDGLVFISIINHSDVAAVNLQVRPDCQIPGMNGTVDVTSFAMFRRITFMAPGKKLKTLVDRYETFFKNMKRTVISFDITFQNEQREKFNKTIKHDLKIYKDLIFFIKKY
jgi:hypothetical protein